MMERKFSSNALFIGALSILGVMIFSPHLAYAQEISSPSILPDSPFYGVKLAIENIQEAFTFQEERRAEILLKHSEERDREAIALELQGKMIPIERLKEIQAEKIRNAEQIILKLERAQNIIDETERQVEERRELAQATTDEERIAIQMQQRAQERSDQSNLIEPRTDMGLLEPDTLRVSDRPVTILAVEDIEDGDEQSEIIQKLRDRLTNSFSTSEITEIRASFAEVREESDPVRQELLADQLDDQVNNPMISITCFGAVSTLSIAQADDPVKELQEQCPILRPLPTEELRKVANGLG